MTDAAVGMMDAAYFTGRKELLDFFNDLLQLNLTKIEQTASGAVACQLTEYVFPNSIPMSRVNWEAKSDYEFIQNYKLLQAAFTKNNVQRHVDVDKLIRAKYQDNLEFCQWLKAFFDQQVGGATNYRETYDPVAVRAKGKGGKKMTATSRNNNNNNRSSRTTAVRTKPTTTTTRTSSGATTRTNVGSNKKKPTLMSSNRQKENPASSSSTDAVVADAKLLKKNADLTQQVSQLQQQVADMELERTEVEKERDFYFEKLRSVEVLLQVHQEEMPSHDINNVDGLLEKVFKVLYATVEDNVVVDDNGELLNSDELGALDAQSSLD